MATQRINDLLADDALTRCVVQAAAILDRLGALAVIGVDRTGNRVVGAMLASGHRIVLADSTTTLPADCVAVFGAMAGRAQAISELRSMRARGARRVHVITIGAVGEIEGAFTQHCIEPAVTDARRTA